MNNYNNISIFKLLYSVSPRIFVFANLLGVITGLLSGLIIPIAMHGLRLNQGNAKELPTTAFIDNNFTILFFAYCFFVFAFRATAGIIVNNVGKDATAKLKLDVLNRISNLKIAAIEEIGFSRLLNVVNEDIYAVVGAAISIPKLLISVLTAVAILGYLAITHVAVFGLVVGASLISCLALYIPMGWSDARYQAARSARDTVQEGVRGLILGSYELRLNPVKAANYSAQQISAPLYTAQRQEKFGDAIMYIFGSIGEVMTFFVIGFTLLVLPQMINITGEVISSIVMALLYIAGPVGVIIGTLEHYQKGQIALRRICDLTNLEEEQVTTSTIDVECKNRLSLTNIVYQYKNSKNTTYNFKVQVDSLCFYPGKIYFIVGGNGSGKTTLSKLISLHYRQDSGEIYFDSTKIDASNLSAARQRIAVIFSNYYLFKKLHIDDLSRVTNQVNEYIEILGLSNKVTFNDGEFSTLSLSDGQRRRLALLVALIEDRDIYIFDEWAADQDPEFKSIFYHQILLALKQKNKIVIVVTHDDRYFNCADVLLQMENGMLYDQKSLTKEPLAPDDNPG
jgi:putative ATP-binding cassette transporter